MSDAYFVGDAPLVAQITKWTFAGTWETTDVITITIGTKTISTTATSTVIATIVTALAATLNASEIPEFAEITWSADTADLVATADVEGVPFTVTIKSSETGGGDADAQTIDGVGTSTLTATGSNGVIFTACSGPNIFNLAANWLTAGARALPADADNIILANCDVDILWGLDLSATTPTSIRRYQSFTGAIGPPRVHETDNGDYLEYRGIYAKFGVSGDAGNIAVYLGLGPGGGPARERWDFSDGRVTVVVIDTGRAEAQDVEACLLLGSHASNSLSINKGSVGIAIYPGETASFTTLNVGYTDNKESDSTVRLGVGVTLGAIVKTGGTLEVNSLIDTSLTHYGGTCVINGSANVDILLIYGGTVVYNTTGTLGGNPSVTTPGVLDFSQDLRAKTVTNPIEVYGDDPLTAVIDPHKVVATLVLDWNQTSDDKFQIGHNIRLTRGTPA